MNTLAEMTVPPLFLSCSQDLDEAVALIDQFGAQACREADRRAAHSRAVGNVSHFCRWRQIARLLEMMNGCDASHTLH